MDNTASQRFDSAKFLKGNPSENLVLSNRPSLLSVLPMGNTATQRFGRTKFSERKPLRIIGANELPPFVAMENRAVLAVDN